MKSSKAAHQTRPAVSELVVTNGTPLLQRGGVFDRLGAFENVEHLLQSILQEDVFVHPGVMETLAGGGENAPSVRVVIWIAISQGSDKDRSDGREQSYLSAHGR